MATPQREFPWSRNLSRERDLDTALTSFDIRVFRPAWWAPGAHGQTVAGRLLRRARFPYLRERLATPDGDFLDLDLGQPICARDQGRPIVVLLHGLEGSSESGYMVEATRQCTARGLRAVALNFRGRSGEPNRRPRAYHAGETGDLAFLLRLLRRRAPEAPLAAIGFSLGGNVLLKYLGELGERARDQLRAAATVSVPFDLAAATVRMEGGIGRLYTRRFLASLRDSVRTKAANGPLPYDRPAALAARTLREFDEAVTAPLHGFRDAGEYYERSSSRRYLGAIRVATLLLQARDDPFHSIDPELEAAVSANRSLVAGFMDRGGHVGFVEGLTPMAARFWAEAEAVRFVAHHVRPPGSP